MLKRNGVLLNLGKHEFLISFQLGAEQLGTHKFESVHGVILLPHR